MAAFPIYDVQDFECGAIAADLYVNTFAEHLRHHAFIEEPHRHNSFLLLFFTAGSGTHDVDFNRYKVSGGSVFLLQPGQLHHWDLSEDTDGFVLIYSGEQYGLHFGRNRLAEYPFYASAYQHPELILDDGAMRSILPYFQLLVQEGLSGKERGRDKMFNLIDCIHIELARRYTNATQRIHPYNAKITQFEMRIEQYFRTHKAPSFYAQELHISIKHLNRICREILDKTASEMIAARTILEAKRMLADRRISINAIADNLGYQDYSYFSRFFRNHTQISPTEFRRQHF